MVEIAICLAIIGFALVAIIGVLPIGMNTQRDNREETIINQDATVFIEAIRNGAHGAGRSHQLRLCHHELLDVVQSRWQRAWQRDEWLHLFQLLH